MLDSTLMLAVIVALKFYLALLALEIRTDVKLCSVAVAALRHTGIPSDAGSKGYVCML